MTIQEHLNNIDYSFKGFIPSIESMLFFNFIKEVNNGREENESPLVHCLMLDKMVNSSRRTAIMAARGLSKALEINTPILTNNGYIPMKDIKVGDIVFDRDGKPTKVTNKSDIFTNKCYKITISTGESFIANEDHLHIVRHRTSRFKDKKRYTHIKEEVLTTYELSKRHIKTKRKITAKITKDYEYLYFLPELSNPVEFNNNIKPDIDPYTVGYLLGDGHIPDNNNVKVACDKKDIDEIMSYIPYKILKKEYNKLGSPNTQEFVFLDSFHYLARQYITSNKMEYKAIPNHLLFSSVENRIELLRGLMDSDGTVIEGHNHCNFCNISPALAYGVHHLVRSLGGFSTIKHYDNDFKGYYIVSFNLNTMCPFKLKRKANIWKGNLHRQTNRRMMIQSIEELEGIYESQCITVDSPTHSYLIDNCLITHNSSILEYLILYLACFEELGSIKKPTFMLYVADSIENGVKRLRSSLEMKYANSEFLQKMIPNKNLKFLATDAKTEKEYELSDNDINDLGNAGRSITDVKITFININGTPLCVRNYGIKTGIRGTREFGTRPTLCHKKGTFVFTNEGYHKVEEYSYKGEERLEKGVTVTLAGLIRSEVVTKEHRYKVARKIVKKERVKYSPPYDDLKGFKIKQKVRYISKYTFSDHQWVEAQDLVTNKSLEWGIYVKDYIVKPIDYSIREVPACFKFKNEYIVHRHISNPNWWYLYGLYLADGSANQNGIIYYFDRQKQHHIDKFLECCKELGYKATYRGKSTTENCSSYVLSDTAFCNFAKDNHRGNSIKNLPEWCLYQPLELQKQLLLGYIAGDAHVCNRDNVVRIVSINEDMINKLGFICERLGLPYNIRWKVKRERDEYIFNRNKPSHMKQQFELVLSSNVKEVLGIDIKENVSYNSFIRDGYVYRKIKSVEFNENEDIFIPIQTPSHTYITQFGLSHNCALDDLLREEDARSDTILQSIENIVYQAIPYALHPTKQKLIWVGTPFNANDPLYKAIESGRWDSLVLPICEKFPCSREEFKGAWEDRFTYEAVEGFYQDAIAKGDSNGFYQELMMSIISDEQLLIKKDNIKYLANKSLGERSDSFNYYITTDFAFSEKTSADWSVISVWAYTNNEDFILVDGVCEKQTMDLNIKDLFRLVARYKPLQVGIEVTGQQGGFIRWIEEEQLRKNLYFDIRQCRPSKDKFSRFLAFAPMYHRGKVYIYEGMKLKEKYYNEYMDELLKVSKTGFKSKHDDVLDTNSMLLDLDLYAPAGSSYNFETDSIESKQDKFYNQNFDMMSYYFGKDKEKNVTMPKNNLIF